MSALLLRETTSSSLVTSLLAMALTDTAGHSDSAPPTHSAPLAEAVAACLDKVMEKYYYLQRGVVCKDAICRTQTC